MNITSFNADGSVSNTLEAIAKQKALAVEDYLPDAWHIWLSNGKRITSLESQLDVNYPGWRDLPLIAKAAQP